MTEEYEICEIIIVTISKKEVGFIASILGSMDKGEYAFEAQLVNSDRRTTIMKSESFAADGNLENWWGMGGNDKRFRELTQKLVADGWEPVGDIPRLSRFEGETWFESATLRRRVNSRPSNESASEEQSDLALLQKLADLRDAGILTEQEFQAKKAEILKRM